MDTGTDTGADTETGTGLGPLVGMKAGTLRLPAKLEGGEETGVWEGEEGKREKRVRTEDEENKHSGRKGEREREREGEEEINKAERGKEENKPSCPRRQKQQRAPRACLYLRRAQSFPAPGPG